MPGPVWNGDDPSDAARLENNSADLLNDLRTQAPRRVLATADGIRSWHQRIYAGCHVPVSGYAGRLRGDASVPELVGYEVGVGPLLADGFPEKCGVWSSGVAAEVTRLFASLHAALARLDPQVPAGHRPRTVDELGAVVRLAAVVHGEWVRIHPFANGNGRTARALAAWLALRYGLPVFVTLKARPGDLAYTRADKDSMGHPPDFIGDHATAVAVFGHMLTLSLMP